MGSMKWRKFVAWVVGGARTDVLPQASVSMGRGRFGLYHWAHAGPIRVLPLSRSPSLHSRGVPSMLRQHPR